MIPLSGICRTVHTTLPCRLLQGVTERDYVIYLPADYESNKDKTYPVFYFMHGGGGSCDDWQNYGNLSQTMDSMIHAGIIQDMIVVCPEGNKNNMMYFNAPNWKYEDFFFHELIPYIDNTYRTKSDKAHRVIAGFSMGGSAVTVYGVHHPEYFSLVYDISGYQRRQPLEFLKNDPSGEWRQQVIEENNPIIRIQQGKQDEIKAWKTVKWMVAVGDHDFTLEANMDLIKSLRAHGIHCNMQVATGDHNWDWVAPHLIDALKYANRLFQ